MKYVYTFTEINFGRIEIEAEHEAEKGEIIEKILEGKADYNDTDFTDFQLVEIDGEVQAENFTVWEEYLRYLRDWADSHVEREYCGMTPASYDEWCDNEYQDVDERNSADSPGSYEVTITETLKLTVEVEADNQQEAKQIVSDNWSKSEYVLDADNFVGVEFTAVP